MLQGTVIKTYSSFYYVEINNHLWECRLRGKFKRTGQNVLAGDKVMVKETGTTKGKATGVIEEVLPRTTVLDRPAVANVDQVLIVFACADPEPQKELLSRMLVQAEAVGLVPIICFNKTDLVSGAELENITAVFLQAGYTVIPTSTYSGLGIEQLRKHLADHITVFAGPSGSGKSSLLNEIFPGFSLKTGKVSEKIGRGRHTTRYTELLKIDEGTLVVDTPGFSSMFLPDINEQDLKALFPEFAGRTDRCKYKGCLHRAEPDCAIKNGVQEGQIGRERYEHYIQFLAELNERERRY